MSETISEQEQFVSTKEDSSKILCLKLLACERKCQMAKPIADGYRDVTRHNEGDIKPKETRSIVDITVECVTGKGSKDLVMGTVLGWLSGLVAVRTGRVAAFGLGGGVIILHFASECGYINVNWDRVREATRRSQDVADGLVRFVKGNSSLPPAAVQDQETPAETQQKPPESFNDEPTFLDKPFLPPKPVPHSPKISPSSIPNPNPSISTSKIETGYPNYGGYLYSIPGYSAFQPVSYPGVMQPPTTVSNDKMNSDYSPFPTVKDKANIDERSTEVTKEETQVSNPEVKAQTDFEEQFTPEIVPAVSAPETSRNSANDSNMSIKSLTQGSGATVTMQSQIPNSNDFMKKPQERFSLKTSIPISKIDIKSVNTSDALYQNALIKKPQAPFNPTFTNSKSDVGTKVEIQSNVVIKNALKETEGRSDTKITSHGSNNINTLINAAEAINKSDTFRKPDPKVETIKEIKDPPPFTPLPHQRSVYNTINTENSKGASKSPDGVQLEQKKQILFIQNKPPSNPKMLLAIQQQNQQVLVQRPNMESKNLQAPSRLSSQSKRCKDDIIDNGGTASKVVALKRLHQENCDENDFENLITENQIYGNKIVVKEKSQGIQQEQDFKKNNKLIDSKINTGEAKNLVLQPNFLYLSNVQFPNLMMIKNNARIHQTNELNGPKFLTTNENKATSEASTMTSKEIILNHPTNHNVTSGNEIHVLKSSNNVLQQLSNKNSKTDLVFQTPHPKVIMNSQIVYQVPMIVDTASKMNQTFNKDYPQVIGQTRKEYMKPYDQKANEKLYIACPYQMDSKLQPKIVITNIRPKIAKVEEVSSLDLYEKRRRLRRLKHLTHRDNKDGLKVDMKKITDRVDIPRSIITPDNMKDEIAKEFATTRGTIDETCSESDSDYEEDDLEQYNAIIKEFEPPNPQDEGKIEFLANFRLASLDVYKDKQMERQEKIIKRDSVASAYIAIGRIDRLSNEITPELDNRTENKTKVIVETDKYEETIDNAVTLQQKTIFLSQLMLAQVSSRYKQDYEKTWQKIVKERKRRNGENEICHDIKQPKLKTKNIDFNTHGQLKMLTEIKNSVNKNINLIKKRLDSGDDNLMEGESIRGLAERNFSELDQLSKMADRSVKLITGEENKRDLNPGFDSENIKKSLHQYEKPFQNYPFINIPNISKIISLKSQETMTSTTMTSQATSMDEPNSCAAGATEMPDEKTWERTKDVGIQVEDTTWPGMEAIMKSYKEFNAARKKEISEFHRRTTLQRVEGAHITCQASRDADQARALLAERRHLAAEESTTRVVLSKLCAAIRIIRNYN